MRRRNSPWLCEDWERIVVEVEKLVVGWMESDRAGPCPEVQNKGIVAAASTPHDPVSRGYHFFLFKKRQAALWRHPSRS
jgi:hypothetical protein